MAWFSFHVFVLSARRMGDKKPTVGSRRWVCEIWLLELRTEPPTIDKVRLGYRAQPRGALRHPIRFVDDDVHRSRRDDSSRTDNPVNGYFDPVTLRCYRCGRTSIMVVAQNSSGGMIENSLAFQRWRPAL
jgi:hypothetical protein